ncbi:MAG: hypothetical protein P1U56_16700 [Saprospiraceae bacterium]|nr:hypothetical protein [Saprospiraceae bacterium]
MALLFVLSSSTNAQISTQIGIGALYYNGDVDPVKDAFNSFHISVNKQIKNNINAELKFGLGKAIGLSGTSMLTGENGGGLVEEVYAFYNDRPWYPNYISDYRYIDLSANYIWYTGIGGLRVIGGGGLGISYSNTSLNLLDSNSDRYTTFFAQTTPIDEVKERLDFAYDPSYETNFDDGGGLIPHFTFQLSLQYLITRGIYFTADVRYHLTASDYLDPIAYISPDQKSGNNDSVSIITFGFVGYLLTDQEQNKNKPFR